MTTHDDHEFIKQLSMTTRYSYSAIGNVYQELGKSKELTQKLINKCSEAGVSPLAVLKIIDKNKTNII